VRCQAACGWEGGGGAAGFESEVHGVGAGGRGEESGARARWVRGQGAQVRHQATAS